MICRDLGDEWLADEFLRMGRFHDLFIDRSFGLSRSPSVTENHHFYPILAPGRLEDGTYSLGVTYIGAGGSKLCFMIIVYVVARCFSSIIVFSFALKFLILHPFLPPRSRSPPFEDHIVG